MTHPRRTWLLSVLALILLVGATLACGGAPTPRTEVLLVTATFTPRAAATVTLQSVAPTAQPDQQPQPGVIAGKLCYPSDYIPPMTIYAREVNAGETVSIHVPVDTARYEIGVPAGTYIVFAWPDTGIGGSYSEFVPCGLSVECTDHTPIPVPVAAGQRVTGIDICDFYQEESVPRP